VLCVGTTAAALAASSHTAMTDAASSQCQVLPTAPTKPAGPSPTITPGTPSPRRSKPATPPTHSAPSTQPASPTQSAKPAELTAYSTATAEICVSVDVVATSVHAGDDALYKISVWPQGGEVGDVTAQVTSLAGEASPALPAPSFTYCGVGAGTAVCSLGGMRLNQASQLQAEIAVPKSAPAGDTVTLAVRVTAAAQGATSAGAVDGSATVSVAAVPKSPSPTPTHKHTSPGGGQGNGSGVGTNSGTGGTEPELGNLPSVNSASGGGGIGTQDPSGLFPTIEPTAGPPNAGQISQQATRKHTKYRPTSVADTLPLNGGQVNGQIAGLIVLGLGLILVFARISLRRPKAVEKD